MPELIFTTVYQFPELSDPAKDKARAWYRDLGAHDDWWDAVYEDFERVCEILGICLKTSTVRLMGGKPLPGAFRKAVAELGLEASRVAMVGDQVFTDVLGGNWAGCKTILVQPLSDNALPHTRLVRKLESKVLGEKQ